MAPAAASADPALAAAAAAVPSVFMTTAVIVVPVVLNTVAVASALPPPPMMYDDDGVPWASLDLARTLKSSAVVDLVTKAPSGLLPLLDEPDEAAGINQKHRKR